MILLPNTSVPGKLQEILVTGTSNFFFNTEAPILWPADVKSQLIRKDPDAGKDWGQEEKGATEDEMFGWHHRLNGHEFEQTLGDSGGQGSLKCCSPWGLQRVRHNLATEQQKLVISSLLSRFCSPVWSHHILPYWFEHSGPTFFLSSFSSCQLHEALHSIVLYKQGGHVLGPEA